MASLPCKDYTCFTTGTASSEYPAAASRRGNARAITTVGQRRPVSRSRIQASGPLSFRPKPNNSPGPIRRTKPDDDDDDVEANTRSPSPRQPLIGEFVRQCFQIINTANSESYPFVLYASLAISPANACGVAVAAFLIFLGSACVTLFFRSRHFVSMLTWRDEVSGGLVTWCNGTMLAGKSKTGGWAWWKLEIGDVVPVDFPDWESFWLSVAVLLAWGVLSRLSTYVRKLCSNNENK